MFLLCVRCLGVGQTQQGHDECHADINSIKKEKPQPPKRLVNIVRCKNPRCISSIEEECDQIFELSSNGKYRCIYCEQELQVKPE